MKITQMIKNIYWQQCVGFPPPSLNITFTFHLHRTQRIYRKIGISWNMALAICASQFLRFNYNQASNLREHTHSTLVHFSVMEWQTCHSVFPLQQSSIALIPTAVAHQQQGLTSLTLSFASILQAFNTIHLIFIAAFCHRIVILQYSFRQLIPTIRDSLRVSNLVLNELLTPSKYIKIIVW